MTMRIVDELLKDWKDRQYIHTHEDGQENERLAEELIHMLLVEIEGKKEVIKELKKDIQYHKTKNHW